MSRNMNKILDVQILDVQLNVTYFTIKLYLMEIPVWLIH